MLERVLCTVAAKFAFLRIRALQKLSFPHFSYLRNLRGTLGKEWGVVIVVGWKKTRCRGLDSELLKDDYCILTILAPTLA